MRESAIPDDSDERWSVVKWGTRFRAQDALNQNAKDAPIYPTREDAQKWVDRKNAQNRKAMRRD